MQLTPEAMREARLCSWVPKMCFHCASFGCHCFRSPLLRPATASRWTGDVSQTLQMEICSLPSRVPRHHQIGRIRQSSILDHRRRRCCVGASARSVAGRERSRCPCRLGCRVAGSGRGNVRTICFFHATTIPLDQGPEMCKGAHHHAGHVVHHPCSRAVPLRKDFTCTKTIRRKDLDKRSNSG